MSKLKFNSLINIELTQESGQTSQSPWHKTKNEFTTSFTDMIYLNINQIFPKSFNENTNIKEAPVILRVSQDENNLNNLDCVYEFAKKTDKEKFSNNSNLSNREIQTIKDEIDYKIRYIYDLDFNLEKFYKYLLDDNELSPSVEFCKGLRLFLAKDPFECIISSICSANNSITRWTKSINKIKSNWGDRVEFKLNGLNYNRLKSNKSDYKKNIFYGFPNPVDFLKFYENPMEEADADGHNYEIDCYTHNLKACGVGYRASYMKKASKIFAEEIDIQDIFTMSYEEAFELILKTPGVGPKVADCILLYGFGFKEAFPSDVWIKRIVSHLYFNDKDISTNKTRDFGIEYFGDYAGYAQLYLFHYARKSGLMDKINK